ncbi:MAG: hypothetical protein A2010_08855 [Nitrospirae bacterium GWD2_57_9]|nr:MAG: hypothetical protein A2010_08855 [Nitrospirae bacterium GWD2_57_9]
MKIVYARLNALPGTAAVTILFLSLTLLLFGFAATVEARDVDLKSVDASEVQGTYSVIGYGCNSASDAPAIAILKKEGTAYNFDVETPAPAFSWGNIPDSEYQMVTGLSASEALSRSEAFVKCNPEVQDVDLRSITGPDGTLLGYEVRPIYSPLRYGTAGLASTSYSVEQNTIVADVRIDPLASLNDWGGG